MGVEMEAVRRETDEKMGGVGEEGEG